MIGTVADAGDAKMNKICFLPSKSSYTSKEKKKIQCDKNCPKLFSAMWEKT